MKLMTAEQVADEYGLPSTRTIRTMRNKGLPAVRIGKAFLFDQADVDAFIERQKETICHAQTEARLSSGTRSASATTSSGMSMAMNDHALLAQQTSRSLKQLSRGSSGTGKPATPKVHAIRP